MATYNLGIQSAAATTLAPYWALRSPAAGRVLRVTQIQISASGATQAAVGLTPPNPGQGPSPAANVSTSPQAVDLRDQAIAAMAATALVDTGWSVAPQMIGSPIFLKEAIINATIGNGVTWTWSDRAPLVIPANSQICLFNFSGSSGPALTVNVHYDE